MNKSDILEELTSRKLLDIDTPIILVDGFEDAFLGITASKPINSIYDYWICLDLLIKREGLDFDTAIDSLDEFIDQDLGNNAPKYLKYV
jgi:hypothetical protein|tara:strand:+ start:15283 stop:15549 length:267 start_codon:yes stop_codon:yes gene_type:complete